MHSINLSARGHTEKGRPFKAPYKHMQITLLRQLINHQFHISKRFGFSNGKSKPAAPFLSLNKSADIH